ncbi:MAG: cell division protein FtsZ [Mediterranea massiliensis]|nr:cell division protein FtsZ [Mediterranea massiliensis]
MDEIVQFDFPTDSPKIIKVIGVGGGGGNAVKHMYRQGIHDVTFVLCNTDSQALKRSDIPTQIQLGRKTTQGLGAGNDPSVAREAAMESIEEIKSLFNDGTQMVFVTAGMGGGTGTGAAPVVARTAKEMGMLTVGIVTIPFLFEKKKKIIQALEGVEEMRKSVDALLVINNERLREIYTDGMTTLKEAYAKADDILAIATKSIAEIITIEGTINLDFRDVRKILKDGGVAIMSTGAARGEKRLKNAIENALHSPLLNNNDIVNAKKILFNIAANEQKAPILIDEMSEIDAFMDSLDPNIEVIWGQADDSTLDDEVKFTLIATGFGASSVPGMEEMMEQRSKDEQERIEEQEARDQERIDLIYGRTTREKRKKRNQIYLFSMEDLDNDDVVAMVENSPTFNRTKSMLADICTKADYGTVVEETEGGEAQANEASSVITF